MLVEPSVLEVGGRSEVLEASGVLFLFPMILLAIVILCTQVGSSVGRKTLTLTAEDSRRSDEWLEELGWSHRRS